LTIFCSCCKFLCFILKLSSKVVPRWKYIFILKLRSLIDVSNSVPACECTNWDAEQLLILENQFCYTIEKILENHLQVVKCIHITSSYMVVCFTMNAIFIHCFTLHDVTWTAGNWTLCSTTTVVSLTLPTIVFSNLPCM
jgi:hypothetical protein